MLRPVAADSYNRDGFRGSHNGAARDVPGLLREVVLSASASEEVPYWAV